MRFVKENKLDDIHKTIIKDMPKTTRMGSSHIIDYAVETRGALEYILYLVNLFAEIIRAEFFSARISGFAFQNHFS